MSDSPIDGRPQGPFANLRRRIYLTYRYFGLRTLLFRLLTLPLRFTPLQRRLRLRTHARDQEVRNAVEWYREHGRPVDIVIPSYRDAKSVRALVRGLRKTVRPGMARVIVSDDRSGAAHVEELHALEGIDLLLEGEQNVGFAANVNRGLRATDTARDVVVLNSDVEALPNWLECLQYATDRHPDAGIVGAQLQYPDGRIQFGGVVRNRDAPEWFDHRYRFKPCDWGPAGRPSAALAVTGACMYVRRAVIDRIGLLDEHYGMAYEDVDWCLRAWQAGFEVLYFPAARLVHHESLTRGTDVGERELEAQSYFWERWTYFFEPHRGHAGPVSDTHARDSHLRIAYVTAGTGVGGGHRDIFEHLNRLADRGHEVSLYTLGDPPDWFPLRVPVHCFADYDALARALAELDAIKVATWWMTAAPVWRASVVRGIPVYFVQDIETSYYPDHEHARHAVLDSYRPEFHYMTISSWNRERLRELGVDAELIPPASTSRHSVLAATSGDERTWCSRSAARTRSRTCRSRSPHGKRSRLVPGPAAVPSSGCSGSSPRSHGARASAMSTHRMTSRLTSSSTRRRCSSRPPGTRASRCLRWRLWPPAPRSLPPTRTATATSASMASTA